jgi:hypothetical protein
VFASASGLPGVPRLQAQESRVDTSDSEIEPGSGLAVFVGTIGPSRELLSRFGHSFIWIQDTIAGTSFAYSYGLSDTRRPDFFQDLVRGRVPSRPARRDAQEVLASAVGNDRSIWIQELRLSPPQRLAFRDALEGDLTSDDAIVLQDPYVRNCTTAIRDLVDEVLHGALRDATYAVPAKRTLREHTLPFAGNDLLLYLGLTLSQGTAVDRPISAWEEMFLPSTLRAGLSAFSLTGVDGGSVPLVVSESRWYQSSQGDPPPEGPLIWPMSLIAGLVLGGVLGVLGSAPVTSTARRLGFAFLSSVWICISGLVGVALVLLWAFTGQYLAYNNENIWHLHPGIWGIWLAMGVGASGVRRARVVASWIAIGVATVSVVGLVAKLLLGLHQANSMVIAFTVPTHLGLAYGVWRWRGGVLRPPFSAPDFTGQ